MERPNCARSTTRATLQLSSLVRTGTTSKWFATNPTPNSFYKKQTDFDIGKKCLDLFSRDIAARSFYITYGFLTEVYHRSLRKKHSTFRSSPNKYPQFRK